MGKMLIVAPGDNGPFETQWRRLRVTFLSSLWNDQRRGLAPLAGKDKIG